MKIIHIMSIWNILTEFCDIKQKIRIKSPFTSIVYNHLVVKSSLIEYKETFSKMNDKQTVMLRTFLIEFKYHFKQLTVPFKIYADFESLF